MTKIAITSGASYVDIDAFSCIIAYRDFLLLQNKDAVAYIPGKLNNSVTAEFREVSSYETILQGDDYLFVIMDVSNPEHFASGVDFEKVIEIFDHHHGFEEFWQEKLGDSATIEMIGACATFIWEEYVSSGLEGKISANNAHLLATAIVSNTLNFNAFVTSQRDIDAFDALCEKSGKGKDWIAAYFEDQESTLRADAREAIVNDTKIRTLDNLGFTLIIGQLEMWNGKDFIQENMPLIKDALESFGENTWFLTSPAIKKGYNYFYSTSEEIKDILIKNLDVEFDGDFGRNTKLLLRKEILKILSQV